MQDDRLGLSADGARFDDGRSKSGARMTLRDAGLAEGWAGVRGGQGTPRSGAPSAARAARAAGIEAASGHAFWVLLASACRKGWIGLDHVSGQVVEAQVPGNRAGQGPLKEEGARDAGCVGGVTGGNRLRVTKLDGCAAIDRDVVEQHSSYRPVRSRMRRRCASSGFDRCVSLRLRLLSCCETLFFPWLELAAFDQPVRPGSGGWARAPQVAMAQAKGSRSKWPACQPHFAGVTERRCPRLTGKSRDGQPRRAWRAAKSRERSTGGVLRKLLKSELPSRGGRTRGGRA
jgi:hypothetical protein